LQRAANRVITATPSDNRPNLGGAPSPPEPPSAGGDPTTAALYLSRGEAMLKIKDISAARRFLEYAYNAGSAQAATEMARTYDPGFLARIGALGFMADPSQAVAWNRKAAELEKADARKRLQTQNTVRER
jgi:TPR repeat protein